MQIINLISSGLVLHVELWFHDKWSTHQMFDELLEENASGLFLRPSSLQPGKINPGIVFLLA